MALEKRIYPCPCCGFLAFSEPPGTYEICGVCGWHDDHVQLRFPLAGGANPPLVEQQLRFLEDYSETRIVQLVAAGWIRCQDWRPLDKNDIRRAGRGPRNGREYFEAAGGDSPKYYWRV